MDNNFLDNNAIEDIIPEVEADIISFKQPSGMTAARYIESDWRRVPRCGIVYNETRLEKIFIGRLQSSIHYLLRTCGCAQNEAILRSLARQATKIVELQKGSHSLISWMREDIQADEGRLTFLFIRQEQLRWWS